MRKGREGRKEKRGREGGRGGRARREGKGAPLSEILNTPLPKPLAAAAEKVGIKKGMEGGRERRKEGRG